MLSLFFKSTTDFTCASYASFQCFSSATTFTASSGFLYGFSNKPNSNFSFNVWITARFNVSSVNTKSSALNPSGIECPCVVY